MALSVMNLPMRAFALDPRGRSHVAELVAEYLKVCDEVVCALHDLPDISVFRPLYLASRRDDRSGFSSSGDIDL